MRDYAESVSEGLILLLVFSLPLMQPLNMQLGRYSIVPTDFVFVIAAMAFGWTLRRHGRRLRLTPWCWALGAYALALIASTAASEAPRRSVVKLIGGLYLLGMALLVVNYVSNEASLRRIIWAWLAGAGVTAAAALCGVVLFVAGIRSPGVNIFLNPFGSLPPGPYPRVMALFQNANMMCTYAVTSALVIVGAAKIGWISGRVSWILLAGTIVTAALSLSPGLGGLFLSSSLWYRQRRVQSDRVVRVLVASGFLAAVAFFCAMLVSPPSALHGLRASIPISQWESSSRVRTWQGAWSTFTAHPWLGRGLGLEAADVRYLNASGSLELLTDAHNTWLSILAQDGLLGGIAFLGVTGFIVSRLQLFSPGSSRQNQLRLALEAAFVGGVLYQTLTGSFENTRHVWVLMAILTAAQDLDDRSQHEVAVSTLKVPMAPQPRLRRVQV